MLKKFNSAIRVGGIQWLYLKKLSERTGIPAATLCRLAIEEFKRTKLGSLVKEDEI